MKRRTAAPGLRARLDEAEATLEAIRAGHVDALVVSGPRGARTLAIEGANHPYHELLNAMGDGAALLAEDGTILFGNRRMQEWTRARPATLRGKRFQDFIDPEGRAAFDAMLDGAPGSVAAGEFTIGRGRGSRTALWLSLTTLQEGDTAVRMVIATDLTERKRTERTRLDLTRRLLTAEDDERRRIARELHDETGQSLTALLVGLQVIEQQTARLDVRETAQRLRKIAAETVDNVGRLARGLHPSILDDLGLLAAVRRYVADYTKAHALHVTLHSDGVGGMRSPSLVQTTIYRILQEALTNVARHAQATRVDVRLMLADGTLELVVRDDGVGFDPAERPHLSGGIGLHGMGERVALLGGVLDIRSAVGKGTTVRVRVAVAGHAGGGAR